MNKLLKLICGSAAAVVLFAGVPSKADDSAYDGKDGKSVRGKSLEERIRELEEKLKDVGYTGVKGSGIKLSGYVDTSYLVNLRGQNGSIPISGANADAGVDTTATYGNGRVFDSQQDEFTLHAVKLTLEKDKDDSDFPAGFRVDLMYGADANFLNNRGIAAGPAAAPGAGGFRDGVENDSDFFLEQAYVNLGLPLGDGVDVKIGKMVTLIGYEVIESPANANFSRSYAFGLAPFTQTGVTFGYNINEYVTATMGLINGFDNDTVINGGGNANTEFSGVYRLDVKSPDWSAGTFNLGISGMFGNDSIADATAGTAGASGTNVADNSTDINIVDVSGTWANVFGHEPLSLGFEVFMRSMHNRTVTAGAAGLTGTREDNSQDDLTAALYAKYQVNDWFYLASRAEYWDADARSAAAAGIFHPANSRTTSNVIGAGGTDNISIYSGTLTAGFNVWKDTLVRLEYRHDEVANGGSGFRNAQSNTGTGFAQIRHGQDTIAVNVAYSF